MRLTYTDLKQQYLRNIAKAGSTDTNILADFNLNLGQRYQLILSKMINYKNQTQGTDTTVAGTQYYSYPPGLINIDDLVVTIGSVQYPLTTIYSQHTWDVLNALQIQPTAIPQFLFPRKDDYGIWPIPQDAYTITDNYFPRDRNLSIDDYTTGTIAVTNGSATITGSGTTFTPAMVGRWFTVTDPTAYGQGYWYRISGYTSATVLTISRTYTGSTASGKTYRIGESPEIPEEGHILLADGPTADFYFGMRNDPTTAQSWENKFWTGDRTNDLRDTGDNNIAGGLIGLVNRYASRDKKRLILKQPQPYLPQYKVWAQTIS